jgi:hypothetical protein
MGGLPIQDIFSLLHDYNEKLVMRQVQPNQWIHITTLRNFGLTTLLLNPIFNFANSQSRIA